MARSVRELKAELTARGVDFSHCCEKCELESLLADTVAVAETSDVTSPYLAASPPAASGNPSTASAGGAGVSASSNNSELEDGGFAEELEAEGRRGWVEFVSDDDALCHWDDGSSGIVPASGLKPLLESDLGSPVAFSGSFEDARVAAFIASRLLVCAIHGAKGTAEMKAERLQTLSLASEEVSALVGENAIFWRGAVGELKWSHAEVLVPQGAPAVAMVLPLAKDAMKVLSTSTTMISKDSMVMAFVDALENLDKHRDAEEARLLNEDAILRMEQDDQFAASLAADQEAAAMAAAKAESDRDVPCTAECIDTAGAHAETGKGLAENEEAAEHLTKKRRLLADSFLAESEKEIPPDAKMARLSLRLPTGVRIERAFGADEAFERVHQWAECCQFLPEAGDRQLGIPANFGLATAFPRKRLSFPEDRGRSLSDLGFAPSAALLLLDEDA